MERSTMTQSTKDVISAIDICKIENVLSLYGFILDDRAWDRLDDFYTDDAIWDLRYPPNQGADAPGGRYEGIDAIRQWYSAAKHTGMHTTINVLISVRDENTVDVRSRTVTADWEGNVSLGTAEYRDVVVRTQKGWRVRNRTAIVRTRDIPPNIDGPWD
jgi:hypothetical protein